MTEAKQNGISGFTMDRAPLRALTHAQGQLIHSHKDILLFLALDTLAHVTAAPQTQALEAICPDAFNTARALGRYRRRPICSTLAAAERASESGSLRMGRRASRTWESVAARGGRERAAA